MDISNKEALSSETLENLMQSRVVFLAGMRDISLGDISDALASFLSLPLLGAVPTKKPTKIGDQDIDHGTLSALAASAPGIVVLGEHLPTAKEKSILRRQGTVVFLTMDLYEIFQQRLAIKNGAKGKSQGSQPLSLHGIEQEMAVLASAYKAVADMTLSTTGISPEQTAKEIAHRLLTLAFPQEEKIIEGSAEEALEKPPIVGEKNAGKNSLEDSDFSGQSEEKQSKETLLSEDSQRLQRKQLEVPQENSAVLSERIEGGENALQNSQTSNEELPQELPHGSSQEPIQESMQEVEQEKQSATKPTKDLSVKEEKEGEPTTPFAGEKAVSVTVEEPAPHRFKKRYVVVPILLAVVILAVGGIVRGYQFLHQTVQKVQYQPSPPEFKEPNSLLMEDNGVINVLLLGTDEWGEEFSDSARADSIMIASVNVNTGGAHLISLERGIGVSIPQVGEDWLTHVFAYGGADLMVQVVREEFGVDIHHYARVNFTAFEKIIDILGGVTIELTPEEAQALEPITQGEMSEGETFLSGADALQYARLRSIDSDFQRIQRQRNILQELVYEFQDISLYELYRLSQEVLPFVQTNISPEELMSLIKYVPKFRGVTLQQMTVPDKEDMLPGTQLADGRILTQIDKEASQKKIDDFLYQDVDPALRPKKSVAILGDSKQEESDAFDTEP